MKLFVKPLVLVLGSVLATSAWTQEAWISVPSTPTPDQRMVISGGNLGPSASLTLRIQHPTGVVSAHALAADASGKLRFEYALGATGSYAVEVLDISGKVIGSGRLGHFR